MTLRSRLLAGAHLMGVAACCLVLLTPAVSAQGDAPRDQPSPFASEAPSLRFEHVGLEEGLAQASALSIMQDQQGFLWIGTQAGLHRYDGHTFKVYGSTPFDTTSLVNNFVLDIAEAGNGDLWVGTEGGGLGRMDRATETFTHYRHDPADSTSIPSDLVNGVFEDSRGDVWVRSDIGVLSRMRAGEHGRFEHFRHDPDDPTTVSSETMLDRISEDAEGYVWVGSWNGVNRIDPGTGAVTRFLYDPDPIEGSDRHAIGSQYHVPDRPGIVWLGTSRGLVRLDARTGAFERFLVVPEENDRRNIMRDFVPDPSDPSVLWVIGFNTGAARFDMRTGTFASYRNDPHDPHSLSSDYTESLFADRTGTIWVGTLDQGLNAFNPGAVNFAHLRHDPDDSQSLAPGLVWGIFEDAGGTLWVATDAGIRTRFLTQFDAATGRVTRHRHNAGNPNSLPSGQVNTVAQGADAQLWVATLSALARLDPVTGRVTRFQRELANEERGRNGIMALLLSQAEPHVLWVGSFGGLDRLDTRTERFTPVSLVGDGVETEPTVLTLHEDAEGVLWAGTTQGLVRVDPSGDATLASTYDPRDTTSISDNRIIAIAERTEEPGILWMATSDGGLNRFDTKTSTAKHYTTEDGLPDEHLYSVLEDASGTLWMSSNRGISNFDPETETFRNYGLDDGLMALEYSQWGYEKGAGGVLYFGSNEGVTAFIPERLSTNEIPPSVALTGLRLFNKSVAVGPDSPLKQPLAETERITLAHDQNEVTFDYVGLHFANPAKNRYAYQLDGFDDEWVEAGGQRSATYTNLPPGRYTFRVKAANSDGVWNEEGASVRLWITPPWWRTWWAYSMFALFLAAGVFAVDRFQRHRLMKEEREQRRLLEARQRELEATVEERTAEIQQRAEELAVINSVQEGLVAELDMQAIYDLVGDRLRDLFDAQVTMIRTFDRDAELERYRYTVEKGERLHIKPRPLDDFSRHLMEISEPDVINDDFIGYIANYSDEVAIDGEDPKSALFVPLIVGDEVKGNVSLQNVDREHAFSEGDVRLLTTLANSMSVALENARLFGETREQAAELDTVNRVSRALVSQLEFDALVSLVGEQMRETFRADIVYVALLDEAAGRIDFPYAYGDDLEPIQYGEGLTSQIIRTKEPLLLNRDVDTRTEELGIERIGKRSASYLGVPIRAGDRALGVISVQSTEEENRFDADDLRLLGTIASNVGVALQNAEAYRSLEETLGELKTMQAQLVQQEKLASLGSLTAGIAHEIKNPLNFVTNFAEVNDELADELREDLSAHPEALAAVEDLVADLQQNARVIRQHGQRADSIVKSMMAHARGGEGTRQAVGLNAFVDEYVDLAYHGQRARVPDFNAEIVRSYEESVGEVELVPQEVGRVLINLLGNAFDAVYEHAGKTNGQYAPRVEVTTRRLDGGVEVRVADNGGGMPESVREKIFEPFFTTKPTGQGTGLGLSMSHDIIHGSGGTLEVESTEGEGATFTLALPTRASPRTT